MPEVDLFKNFVDRLTSWDQEMNETYQTDRYLRTPLFTAVKICSVQEAVNDRQPRTAHHLIEREYTIRSLDDRSHRQWLWHN